MNHPVLWRSHTHRHLQGERTTRALCGASIAWANITTKRELADCPRCVILEEPGEDGVRLLPGVTCMSRTPGVLSGLSLPAESARTAGTDRSEDVAAGYLP